MNAAPTPADSTSPSAYPEPDIAYAIGWEHARRGCVPPAEQLQPDNPVRLGWEAGRARFGRRTLPADHHVRQWLRLRLDAWQQGLGFEPLQLNPARESLFDFVYEDFTLSGYQAHPHIKAPVAV